MSASAGPLCSVVIPTLDAGPEFAQTLAALRAQQGIGEPELLVLDSESRDATAVLARDAGARVRMIRRATFDHGFTRNLGAALARGRFVAFLTQDALPHGPHWLVALVEAMEREGAVGGYSRVLARPGCSPLVARHVEGDLVHSPERQVKRLAAAAFERLSPFERRVYCHFNNVASCVRRDWFARHPFPVIPFGEDLAWGTRAIELGEALVYEPRSVVLHSHASDLRADYLRHRADAQLMRTLYGMRNRDGWRDCLPAWWREVAADRRALARSGAPLSARLRWLLYSPLLRAAQLAGQLAGSHGSAVAPARWLEALPPLEAAR